MEPGTRVRLQADPGRTGVATGRSRERGGHPYIQVGFPDRSEYVPLRHIEVIPEMDDDTVALLQQGRFGRAKDLRGNMTHIRLNGQLANLIYSMETTNTDFYPYQFKPVLKFLDSPHNGLLIADEVGLGKTIEAGLIWTELRNRSDTRCLMVLCPAFLRSKWKGELRDRFGIAGEVLGPAEVLERFKEFRAGTRLDDAMICSMQSLRPRRGWDAEEARRNQGAASELARFLEASEYEEPLLDLLIVDEAHYLRNPDSMTARLGRLLRAVAEHVVLLSATPIHLKNRDLYGLLNLIDEDTFNQPHMFEEILQANAPLIRARDAVMRRRLSTEEFVEIIEETLDHPIWQGNRQLNALLDAPPSTADLRDNVYRTNLANRLESINLLGHSFTRTRKRDVEAQRVVREAYAEQVPLSPIERQFYDRVTALVRRYCQKREAHEGFLLVMPQRQMSSCIPAALQEWQQRGKWFAEQVYEDLGVNERQDDDIEMGPLSRELAENAHELGEVTLLRQHDSKYKRLKDRVTEYLREYPKEKIVLFAYFRATLWYLKERLTADGIHCSVLTGSDTLDRDEILEAFQDLKGPQILLASEVASEGIDLQFARVLINYDLPWNPMRIEQRIGRIDRIGQQGEKIFIWNLFYDETIDSRIYTRLHHRLHIFEQALGGLEVVLGEAIQKLTFELLRGDLTPAQEAARIEQTAQALANQRDQEERLEEEASHLVAHGDYILNQVKAAHELERWITGEDLWIYIHDFFQQTYSGCEFQQLKPDEYVFDVKLSDEAKFELEHFLRRQRLYVQTRLASGSAAPVRCRFVNRVVGNARSTEEMISQLHPLVRFVSSKIRQMDQNYFSPVSVELGHQHVPSLAKGPYVFVVNLWSLEGVRDIERLCFVVKPIHGEANFLSEEDAEQLVTTTSRRGKDWLAARNVLDLDHVGETLDDCFGEAERLYETCVKDIETANNDRADVQIKTLRRHQSRQLDRLNQVLDRHRMHGRASLVRATQGRIAALQGRIERKCMAIEQRRELRHHKQDVCIGVINVI
ncbi:RNA polymerase-associated protein RapA [Candidatus Entotheonellaceae bacterium PAL068K]